MCVVGAMGRSHRRIVRSTWPAGCRGTSGRRPAPPRIRRDVTFPADRPQTVPAETFFNSLFPLYRDVWFESNYNNKLLTLVNEICILHSLINRVMRGRWVFTICRLSSFTVYFYSAWFFDDTFFLYIHIILRSLFIKPTYLINYISSFYGLSSQSFETCKRKDKKGEACNHTRHTVVQ